MHNPAREAVDALLFRAERLFGLGKSVRRPLRLLLLSDHICYTSEQQFEPLLAHRGHLRRCHGILVHHKLLRDALAKPESARGFDAVLLKMFWQLPQSEALSMLEQVRRASAPAKIIYCDGDDPATIQWGEVLGACDLYVKKQVLADLDQYQRRFEGTTNLTDYVARAHGWDFKGEATVRSGCAGRAQTEKIALGHNIALDRKIGELLPRARRRRAALMTGRSPAQEATRAHDIVCRAHCGPEHWIAPLRNPVAEALAPLASRYRVLLPTDRVPQGQYYDEMFSSRICVSPFGFGEVCWRDFEAVLCGCLLVKPDMAHIRTEPNVYIANETYVPCKWDFSDLADLCARWLEDEAGMRRIRENAWEALDGYLRGRTFAKTLARNLERAGVAIER